MTSEHLDDDTVSALLDGEATPEEAAHAEGCGACAERLERFRAAAAVLGTPVPPPPDDDRERAIAAALAARVVPLERRRRGLPTWMLGAAAAVVLALIMVPLLGDTTDDEADMVAGGDARTTADAPAAEESAGIADDSDSDAGGSEAAEGTMSLRAAGPVAAGDLGALDATTVSEQVRAVLVGPEGAVDGQSYDAGAPTTNEAAPEASAPCEDSLRAGDPDLGGLRLTGTATVDGRGGAVVVFDVAGSDPPLLRAYVVAGDGCDVLLRESFPAAP